MEALIILDSVPVDDLIPPRPFGDTSISDETLRYLTLRCQIFCGGCTSYFELFNCNTAHDFSGDPNFNYQNDIVI